MFTGLVETIGLLRRRAVTSPAGGAGSSGGARLFVEASLGPLSLGESINVQGACLTVDRIAADGFECDLSVETLARSTLGALPLGSRVHLERATPLGGRLGGHLVLGHVDGTGKVVAREAKGQAVRLGVSAPAALAALLAPKGSVALDGVSLTVNEVGAAGGEGVAFDVMLVPHTLSRTLLGEARPGAALNLEVDVLARYVARQLAVSSGGAAPRPRERGERDGSDVDDERILAKLGAGGFL
jgi:riboflavin synthase